MASKRLKHIPGFSIDQIAKAANDDPDILRMENLDTDLLPPFGVIEATKQSLLRDEDNSYLPFIGKIALRERIAQKLSRQTQKKYDANQVVITAGGTEGMLNTLLAVTDPGDEVLLTDPTYAGMIYRVNLVGAIPKLIPFRNESGTWRLDLNLLKASISPNTKAIFLMNPSMPSGAVLSLLEWKTIAELCQENNLWLIYNAAMERILFDNLKVIHPAALPHLEERTITIGSVSKEYRMIGWRVGWVAGPAEIMSAVAKAHIYNVVTPPGITQSGALTALNESDASFQIQLLEWEKRRNMVMEQLKNYAMIPAAGGWSQLLDVSPLGIDAETAAKQLLEIGKVAATPMTNWGLRNSKQYIRLVFSNEPVKRLQSLGKRFFLTFER